MAPTLSGWRHSAARARQRFGYTLGLDEYSGLCKTLAFASDPVCNLNGGRKAFEVRLGNKKAYAVFDRWTRTVRTFLTRKQMELYHVF